MTYQVKEGLLVDEESNIVHCHRKEEMAVLFEIPMSECEDTMKMLDALGLIRIHNEKDIPLEYRENNSSEVIYYSIPQYDQKSFEQTEQVAKVLS